MKQPKEVPPLRVGAHLRKDKAGHPQLEWSKLEDFEETVDIGFPRNKATEQLNKLKKWVDSHIGAYEDEIRILRRLHRTRQLEVVVTDEHETPEQIAPVMEEYWRLRQSRHYRRMIIAGLAVLPALLLTVLPGPNIVGIPLAYLAWHHWRIVRGLNRVRSGDIQVELKSPPRVIPFKESESPEPSPDARIDHESNQASDVQHT